MAAETQKQDFEPGACNRKTVFEPYEKKKKKATELANKTSVILGDCYERWCAFKKQKGLHSDASVAKLLLDSYEEVAPYSTTAKTLPVRCVLKPCAVDESFCSSEKTLGVDEVLIMEESECASQLPIEIQNVGGLQYRTISKNEDQPGSIEVTLAFEQTEDCVSDSEIPAQSNEENDYSHEEEDADADDGGNGRDDASSDEDWIPQSETIVEVITSSEEESEVEDESRQALKQLCTDCGVFYYSRNHTCMYKSRPFVCNVCGKRCVTELSLNLHNKIHNECYEHPCKYCCVIFKSKLDKLRHQRTHKNQAKPYKCPHCSESFATNKSRRTHLKKHATKDIKCDICGISFWKRHRLMRHMLTHTGVKPYKCSVCDRSFNQGSHLKSHMRLHTGEKPYKCQYCEESFNHNVSLKSHVQRHHTMELGDEMDKKDDGSSNALEAQEQCVDTVQKEQQEKVVNPKYKRQSTGRPIGRPKRNTADKSKYFKTMSPKKNVNSTHEDYADSDLSFDPQEEKMKPISGSDSDYDPEKETKKCRGQTSGKRKGRPRKIE